MPPLSFLSQTAYQSRSLGGATAVGAGTVPQVQPKSSEQVDRSSLVFQQSLQAFAGKYSVEPVSFEPKNQAYTGISLDPNLQGQHANYYGKEDIRNTLGIA